MKEIGLMLLIFIIAINSSEQEKKLQIIDDAKQAVRSTVYYERNNSRQDLGPTDLSGFITIPKRNSPGDKLQIIPDNSILYPPHSEYCKNVGDKIIISRNIYLSSLKRKKDSLIYENDLTSAKIVNEQFISRLMLIDSVSSIKWNLAAYKFVSKILRYNWQKSSNLNLEMLERNEELADLLKTYQ